MVFAAFLCATKEDAEETTGSMPGEVGVVQLASPLFPCSSCAQNPLGWRE